MIPARGPGRRGSLARVRQARLPRTISTYLIREIVLYSAIGFAVITVVLMSQNLLRHLEEIAGIGFEGRDLLRAIGALSILFMAYALPTAFLLGCLVAIRRMKSDAELLAMQACGIGIGTLLAVAMGLGVIVSSCTAFLVIEAEHFARGTMRSLVMNVAARGNILQAGRFRHVAGRVLYVEDRQPGNRLRGIMIASESEGDTPPYVIFSDRGHFAFDREREMLRIRLDQGDIHLGAVTPDDTRSQRISFDRLDYEIDIRHLLAEGSVPSRPKQMSLAQLRAARDRIRTGSDLSGLDEKNASWYAFEAHRRFALPVAPLLFAVLAVALGASSLPGARSWALVVGTAIAFGYYLCLSFGGQLAEDGWLAAGAAIWGTTALFALLGLLVLRHTWRTQGR